jgi:hypothetical protein
MDGEAREAWRTECGGFRFYNFDHGGLAGFELEGPHALDFQLNLMQSFGWILPH